MIRRSLPRWFFWTTLSIAAGASAVTGCSSSTNEDNGPKDQVSTSSGGGQAVTSSGSAVGTSSGEGAGQASSGGAAGASSGTTGTSSGEVGTSSGEAGSSSGEAAFALSSSAFTEGAKIPCLHVGSYCGGGGQSPALSWSAGPAGTQSYAVVLRDPTINNVHWVLYDIPASVTSLAPNVPRSTQTPNPPEGSKQSHPSWDNTHGYAGPCPVEGPNEHTYTFTVYARPVANEAGIAPSNSVDNLASHVSNGALAAATLSGTQDAKENTCSD